MMYIGADRCKGGWIVVVLDNNWNHAIDLAFSTVDLFQKYASAQLILLDIPIGIRDTGSLERLCDLEARRVLGPRQSSVFPVPCRQALAASNYEEASRWNEQVTGRKLSKQSWAIAPVIHEVDMLVSSNKDARRIIREMHPEVCFWGLNGKHPMLNYKKDEGGYHERRVALSQIYPRSEEIVAKALAKYPSSIVRRDDIVDALVGAVTAKAHKLETLPVVPECDSRGLPMEMVYSLSQNHGAKKQISTSSS